MFILVRPQLTRLIVQPYGQILNGQRMTFCSAVPSSKPRNKLSKGGPTLQHFLTKAWGDNYQVKPSLSAVNMYHVIIRKQG